MGSKFYDNADAYSKLHGSIIMYDGEPWFVLDARTNIARDIVVIQKIGYPDNVININYTDPKFDYQNIELGYFTDSVDNTYHMCRRPGRFAFVGIKLDCLDTMISQRDYLGMPMYNCIMGIHPTFSEACKSTKRISPFHRHAAIVRRDVFNRSIVWMNKDIANLSRNGDVIPLENYSSDYGTLLKRIGAYK